MRTTSSWWLLNMAEYFRRMGLSVDGLFKQAGISFQSLMFANNRYPQDGVTRLWNLVANETQNLEVGFLVGSQLSIAGLPVLGHSIVSAPSIKEGFNRFFRYQRVLGESANIQLKAEDDVVRLSFKFVGDDLPICIHTYDMAVTATVSMIRVLASDDWAPREVLLTRAPPKNDELFCNFFRCPIRYQSFQTEIVIAAEDLRDARPDKQGFDATLSAVESNASAQPLSRLVAMYVSQELQNPSLDKAQVATALNMSARTLQRKLQSEGHHFQGLLEKIRQEKAVTYLADPSLSLTEIAFLCGFSDATAFNRAFRRWLGVAPGEYRKLRVNPESNSLADTISSKP